VEYDVTMMDKLVDLWYCKSMKHTGKPIMVRDFKNGKANITNTNKWSMGLFDKDYDHLKLMTSKKLL